MKKNFKKASEHFFSVLDFVDLQISRFFVYFLVHP